jgi:predicted Fe-Mo cluster-binding NifX family protein
MVKLLVPVQEFKGLDSTISPHFGRAPLLAEAIISKEGDIVSLQSLENTPHGERHGHGGTHKRVADLEPDALVVMAMGPRGLRDFGDRGIAVFTGSVRTIGEAVEAYVGGDLSPLTEACHEAKHKF